VRSGTSAKIVSSTVNLMQVSPQPQTVPRRVASQPQAQPPRTIYVQQTPATTDVAASKHQLIYWAALGIILVGSGVAIWLLYKRFKTKIDEAEESKVEYQVRAEEYARRKGVELARAQLESYMLANRGVRHDIGDPGILPDLACTSSFQTNERQRCDVTGQAVTTSTDPIGIRLKPVPENAQPDLQPADAGSGNMNDGAGGAKSTSTTATSVTVQQQ